MTNHETAIKVLRAKDTVYSRAAASLLEVHDTTGINLYTAPDWLAFVKAEMVNAGINAVVEQNYA